MYTFEQFPILLFYSIHNFILLTIIMKIGESEEKFYSNFNFFLRDLRILINFYFLDFYLKTEHYDYKSLH